MSPEGGNLELAEENKKLVEDLKKLAEEKNKLAEENKKFAAENTSGEDRRSPRSYRLVFLMVLMLGFLVSLILIIPWVSDYKDNIHLDYYKYSLGILLGAFGAWIGAGAAYFFGKENLQESSRSTESALRIQRDSFGRPPLIERIKDMTLTAMNPNFFFDFDKKKRDVRTKLDDFKGYWFVPVVATDTGVLQDIIHAQVFWDSGFAEDSATIKQIVSRMDEDKTKSLAKLHGDLFYIKVSLGDKISDVYNQISQKDAQVAIVVDEKGKPSHCLSKTDLRTFLKA
jgi:hypothetical protein